MKSFLFINLQVYEQHTKQYDKISTYSCFESIKKGSTHERMRKDLHFATQTQHATQTGYFLYHKVELDEVVWSQARAS